MSKESNLEFKVGGIVLLGLLCLTIFILSISDSSLFEEKKILHVTFSFASGLNKSAPVRIAGVDSGLVTDVNLIVDEKGDKTKAEVILWVKKDLDIPIDSKVLINQLGLFGEKYVEILPGKNRSEFFKEGDVIMGKDPVIQEEISEKIIALTSKLDSSVDGINMMINDKNNQESVKIALKHLKSISGNLDDITGNIKSGQGTVGRLFYDERIYDDLQALTSDLKANPWKLLYRPKGK